MEEDLLLSEESLTESITEIKEHLRDAERKRGFQLYSFQNKKLEGFKKELRELKARTAKLAFDKDGGALKDINSMSVDEKLDLASQIQQNDIQSLIEANKLAEESKEVGIKTIGNLINQNEQLDNAAEYVRILDSNLDIAKKELAAIRRGMCGDAMIRVIMVVLIVIAVLAVLLLIFAPPASTIIEGFKPKKK